jgi:hypothetical protein
MTPVRCATCLRTVAYADTQHALRVKVYCDEMCRAELAATPTETRNDQWDALVAFGWSPILVAQTYDAPHSQVYRTVARFKSKV